MQAARYAQTLGVKIYTILAGDNDPEAPRRRAGSAQRHPVNPKLLEQIASMTGGTPYLATDTRALAERFQKILEDLEKSRIHDRGIALRRALPALPAGRRSRCSLLEIALRLTRFRRFP